MGKFIDMTGWVMSEHGVPDSKLTVIERAEDQIDIKTGKPKTMWKCKCNCSNDSYCIVSGTQLRCKTRATKSCGCIKKEQKWTSEQIDILTKMYLNEDKIQNIVDAISKTHNAIESKIHDLKLSKNFIRPNNSKFKAIYQDYNWCYERFINRGMTMREMANEAGASLRVIQKWCQQIHNLNARTYKKYKKLNNMQKQIIMFGKIGDGHIDKREDQPVYIESHAENQKDYVFWKWSILKDLCTGKPIYYPSKEYSFGNDKTCLCQSSYRLCTRVIDELKDIRAMTLTEVLLQLNEFGISLHSLDDGFRSEYTWEICLAEWNQNDIDLYLQICKDRFNITGKQRRDKRYIGFDSRSSIILDNIILRNIPNDLDIIKYKILKTRQRVVNE